jgi:DNA repair protein RadC
VKGLGPAKFTQLQAVMELARRAILEELQAGSMLSSPRAVKTICAPPLRASPSNPSTCCSSTKTA